MTCQICDGPQKLIGNLGSRAYLRCINCGMDSSIDVHKALYENYEEAEEYV